MCDTKQAGGFDSKFAFNGLAVPNDDGNWFIVDLNECFRYEGFYNANDGLPICNERGIKMKDMGQH